MPLKPIRLLAAAAPLALAASIPAQSQPTPSTRSATVARPVQGPADPARDPVRQSGPRRRRRSRPTASNSPSSRRATACMNLWVAPIGDVAAAKPLTAEKTRPIRQYFWSPDSKQLLFINDKGGDENFLLYGVDTATGEDAHADPVRQDPGAGHPACRTLVKDRILVGVNNRDRQVARRPQPRPRHRQADPGADQQRRLCGLPRRPATSSSAPRSKSRADGGSDYYRIVDNKVEADAVRTGRPRRLALDRARRLHRRRQDALLDRQPRPQHRRADRAGRRHRQAHRHRRGSPAPTSAASSPTRAPARSLAYGVNYLRSEWKPLDAAVGGDLDFLEGKLKGDINVTSRTTDNDKWTVAVDPVTAPSSVWLYDRKAKALTKLYTPRPALEGMPLAAMHPVEIKARDGLTLPSYLTLPPGSDAERRRQGRPPGADGAAVHGGPWGARRLWLQHRPPIARQPRLCGAVGQLPRLDRLRQGFRHRVEPAMGPQDARRPARRGRLGGRAGRHHRRQGRDHGRQLRRLCHARRA